MPLIKGEIVIERPIEDVFDFVSDECNEPRYNPQMTFVEQASSGPIGLGTRFDAVVRSGGRPVPMEIEYTEFERPLRLGSRAVMAGMVTEGGLTFERVGESTLMRWRWDVQVAGALRLLAPVVGWIGVRQERRVWSGLKGCMEARPPRDS
jgi:uncharacterized protein YndB with AHSA1/START domain